MSKIWKRSDGQDEDNDMCLFRHSCLVITVMLSLSVSACFAMEESSSRRIVGGQCDYKKYDGRATIVSVQRKELLHGYRGPAYEQYEVKFTFHPDETILEKHGQIEGRESLLLLKNSWYPGSKFLEKYGIEEGRSFDCHLKVIIRGACTPVIFDFPTIDRGDYFENQ